MEGELRLYQAHEELVCVLAGGCVLERKARGRWCGARPFPRVANVLGDSAPDLSWVSRHAQAQRLSSHPTCKADECSLTKPRTLYLKYSSRMLLLQVLCRLRGVAICGHISMKLQKLIFHGKSGRGREGIFFPKNNRKRTPVGNGYRVLPKKSPRMKYCSVD